MIMNNILIKDSFKVDVFKFDLEKQNSVIEMTINNSISWDWIKMKLTTEELKNLSNFINTFLQN